MLSSLQSRGRMCPRQVRGAVFRCALLLMLGAVCGGGVARAEEAGGDGNAALFYWKAGALLQEPRSAEDLATLRFIEQDFKELPPAALAAYPAATRWLLDERPAMAALAAGARLQECAFALGGDNAPTLDLSHLPTINRVVSRALQAAKAYEYVDNREGAATIYASLLRLAVHLDQDQSLKSAVVGAEIIQDVLRDLTGFVAREPSSAAMTVLTRKFAKQPRPLFHMDADLLAAAERQARWLRANPDRVEERLAALYEDIKHTPAVDQLLTLSPERKMERLSAWLADYTARVQALAEATRKPYQLGLYAIRDIDKEKSAMKNAAPSEVADPLVPLLLPTMEQVYERLLLAEAHYTMADILCSAGLYHADLKSWPRTLDEISKFVGRSFPRDPFTGQAVQYRLRKKAPALGVRAPRWLVEEAGVVYKLDVGSRRARDEAVAEKYIDAVRRRQRRENIRRRKEAMEKEKK